MGPGNDHLERGSSYNTTITDKYSDDALNDEDEVNYEIRKTSEERVETSSESALKNSNAKHKIYSELLEIKFDVGNRQFDLGVIDNFRKDYNYPPSGNDYFDRPNPYTKDVIDSALESLKIRCAIEYPDPSLKQSLQREYKRIISELIINTINFGNIRANNFNVDPKDVISAKQILDTANDIKEVGKKAGNVTVAVGNGVFGIIDNFLDAHEKDKTQAELNRTRCENRGLKELLIKEYNKNQ